jgi:hypothetical protein
MSQQHNKTSSTAQEIRTTNLAGGVTNWRVQTAGRNASDKPAFHFAAGTMNSFSFSNIKIRTHHLKITCVAVITHLAPRNYDGDFTYCQERKTYQFLAQSLYLF